MLASPEMLATLKLTNPLQAPLATTTTTATETTAAAVVAASKAAVNCVDSKANVDIAIRTTTALSSISRSSSQQNVDTDSGKSSCSPALLDCSFDSGISGGGVVGNAVAAVEAGNTAIDSDAHGHGNRFGIGTGIGCIVEEQARQILRERIQQWRGILLALERQKDVYRQLRERLSKISDKNAKKSSKEQQCNVCCHQLDLQDAKSFVTSCLCNKHICRGAKCAEWLPKSAEWECQLCHTSKASLAHTSSWVAEQMSFNRQKYVYPMRARSEIYIPIGDFNDAASMHFESVSQVGVNSMAAINAEQKLKIREYVEEVLADMLGGSLEQIRVGQLSKSENYLPAIVNGQQSNDAVTQSQSLALNNNAQHEFSAMSQARLRQLIESIIAETLHAPSLVPSTAASESALNSQTPTNGSAALPLTNGNVRQRRHRTEHYFEPKIYQDLLATAVLNKIVDNEGNVRPLSESTPDLRTQNIDPNYNVENQSTTSGSSVEPRSDCSYTDTEQVPEIGKAPGRESILSDYLAKHTVPLPNLSAPVTESEEDDQVSITSSALVEGTWEDNWLFKKKHSSLNAPITGNAGMLVPAPKEDVRAQIGDKTTDEISDLSEMGSDTDDSSMEVLRANLDPLNDRILNKHLIGGQNTKIVLDELIETASMISDTPHPVNQPKYTDTKNEHAVETALKTEAINPSVGNLSVQAADTGLVSPPTNFKDDQNPLSDQLSSDSNYTDESAPTTIESFAVDSNKEQDKSFCLSNGALNIPSYPISLNVITTNMTNNNKNTNINTIDNNAKLTNGLSPANLTSYYVTDISEGQHIAANNSNNINEDDDDVVLLRKFVPGSIAEREYKKWYNAVEMPNNPYAPEALKQRISGSQERFMDLPNISPTNEPNPITLMKNVKDEVDSEEENRESDYKRYSRDYYINDDKPPKTSPKRQSAIDGSGSGSSIGNARPSPNISDEPTADIAINEAENANEQPITPTHTTTTLYQAVPAQVVDVEHASIETISNQSLQSVNTTTSEDSDTVRIYDFKKQQTITIRNEPNANTMTESEDASAAKSRSTSTLKAAGTVSTSVESLPGSPVSTHLRPTELQFERGAPARAPITPTRGSTPMAFKFLQPKRKLIDPSQVLSLDEDDAQSTSPPGEKVAVEEDVAQVMPSVKALAQAFLLTTSKCTQAEKRWKTGVKSIPVKPSKPDAVKRIETCVSIAAEAAEDATIASDLSSLETDPPTNKEETNAPSPIPSAPLSPSPEPASTGSGSKSVSNAMRRVSLLRSNIAFFENLKFK